MRRKEILRYYRELKSTYAPYYPEGKAGDPLILKRFKALCRYLFEDYENGDRIKSLFLRAMELDLFFELLEQFSEGDLALPEIQQEVAEAAQDA
jgi:hypothetical protein